jgi:hypothetical protein
VKYTITFPINKNLTKIKIGNLLEIAYWRIGDSLGTTNPTNV